jgi:hypothetical protein
MFITGTHTGILSIVDNQDPQRLTIADQHLFAYRMNPDINQMIPEPIRHPMIPVEGV